MGSVARRRCQVRHAVNANPQRLTAPAVSIVIATFNRARLLERTLQALRHQDFTHGDEVIVVDNGSADETPSVIEAAARDFPVPLRPLTERTQGKGPALDRGIAAALGSILALIDDDVVVAPDWLAAIRQMFSDPSLALVGGRVDPEWECPPPRWLQVEPHVRYGMMTSPLALQHYGADQELGPRTAVGANLAIRRDVLDALGGFRSDLARRAGTLFGVEDQDLCSRARQAGYRCIYRSAIRVGHWVPAERLRLSYFTRWFFWSGYGDALLGTDDPVGADGRRHPIPWYHARRVPIAASIAVANVARGRFPAAAEMAMDAAYSLGYVAQRVISRVVRLAKVAGLVVISALALSGPRGVLRPHDMFPCHSRQVARLARTSRDCGSRRDGEEGLMKGARGYAAAVGTRVAAARPSRTTVVRFPLRHLADARAHA